MYLSALIFNVQTLKADLAETSAVLKGLELVHQNTLSELQAKIHQQDTLQQQHITVCPYTHFYIAL